MRAVRASDSNQLSVRPSLQDEEPWQLKLFRRHEGRLRPDYRFFIYQPESKVLESFGMQRFEAC